MRGVVTIVDGDAVHVIPRAEVRHVEISPLGGDGWALKYQLADTVVIRTVEWRGDLRPDAAEASEVDAAGHNRVLASTMLGMLTRGYRDLCLERRSAANAFLVREDLVEEESRADARMVVVRDGLVEDAARVRLCRKFVAEMAFAAVQTALGPMDEVRRKMLWEIRDAAKDLVLPDWYPVDAKEKS